MQSLPRVREAEEPSRAGEKRNCPSDHPLSRANGVSREENRMRTLLAVPALALIAAAPPHRSASPDAKLRAIVAPVSQAQLRHTIATLVGFGTRHTLSSQTDSHRGIGAAVAWALEEFGRDSGACGECLRLVRPGEVFTGDRIPTPTWVYDAVAIQVGTERPN